MKAYLTRMAQFLGRVAIGIWNGVYRRPVLLALAALFLVLWLASCALPVRPIARIVPDQDGSAHFERDAEREPQPGNFLGLVAQALPSPWRELATLLVGSLVAAPLARRPLSRALEQTVSGIEQAKGDLPDEEVAKLHACLAKSQDPATKRRIWELRP